MKKVPKKELLEHYPDILELVKIIPHDIVEDNNVWRFKKDTFVDYLWNDAAFYTPPNSISTVRNTEHRGSISLNGVWIDFHHGKFEIEDFMKFYMGLGYSLSGFIDCFGQTEHELKLPGAKVPDEDNDEYTQTLIDYVIDKHKKGK